MVKICMPPFRIEEAITRIYAELLFSGPAQTTSNEISNISGNQKEEAFQNVIYKMSVSMPCCITKGFLTIVNRESE